MRPLIFTKDGKRIATLTPQEGKAGEVFTLGTASGNDIVIAADSGLAAKQLSFSTIGDIWWVGDLADDGRLEVDGRLLVRAPVTGSLHIKVGAFEVDVATERGGDRKTRREIASEVLYAHALASLSAGGTGSGEDELRLESLVGDALDRLLARGLPELEGFDEKTVADLKRETIEDMLRLGPLEPLIADDSITEIMTIDYRHTYVDR